jgi:endoglucanase
MKLSGLVAGAASLATVLGAPAEDAAALDKRAGKFVFTGVSVAGGEFGNKALPGQLNKDYTWPDKAALDVSNASYSPQCLGQKC